LELSNLRVEDLPKGASQEWIVEQQRVLASAKKFADTLVLASQLLRNRFRAKFFREVDVQPDVEP
jgi:hypothetical protein